VARERGDEGEAFGLEREAVQERPHAEREAHVRLPERLEARGGLGLEAVLGEVLDERLAPSRRFGEQHHPGGRPGQKGLESMKRVGRAPLYRELG